MSGRDIYYANNIGGSWNWIQIVDIEEKLKTYIGQYCSIAIDGDNRPHISYFYNPGLNTALMHAWYDAPIPTSGITEIGNWRREKITEGGRDTDIFVEDDGTIHISYGKSYSLYYAYSLPPED